jgi:hypothetical protein
MLVALFQIVFELPEGSDATVVKSAVDDAGYHDAQVFSEDRAWMFSVLISHPDSKFDMGTSLAKLILSHLPAGSRYLSHRSAVSIQEMSAEELDALLVEIESATYGQAAV